MGAFKLIQRHEDAALHRVPVARAGFGAHQLAQGRFRAVPAEHLVRQREGFFLRQLAVVIGRRASSAGRQLQRFLIRQIQRDHFLLGGLSFIRIQEFIRVTGLHQLPVGIAHVIRVRPGIQTQHLKRIPRSAHPLAGALPLHPARGIAP